LRIWKDGTAALNQHLFKVIEREGIDRQFLRYLIDYHLPFFNKAAHGSTMQHITRKELSSFEVKLPNDEKEQVQIAAILTTIDKIIDQTGSIIEKQTRIKTGLMQDLLTRGIDEYGNIRSENTHAFKTRRSAGFRLNGRA
jgi:type I restriction enzyme S subunit